MALNFCLCDKTASLNPAGLTLEDISAISWIFVAETHGVQNTWSRNMWCILGQCYQPLLTGEWVPGRMGL